MAKRVLIVDDALFMREMLQDIFEAAGWQVAGTAENGEEALAEYKIMKPDLVTMDLVMPGSGGIEALKNILYYDSAARVIVCSALGHKNQILEAVTAGAKDFIVKPFKGDQVIEIAERVIAQ